MVWARVLSVVVENPEPGVPLRATFAKDAQNQEEASFKWLKGVEAVRKKNPGKKFELQVEEGAEQLVVRLREIAPSAKAAKPAGAKKR